VGKKYKEKKQLVEANKDYSVEEAIALVKQLSTSTFDGTVELAIKLGIETKHSDQQIRGTLTLPNGIGKEIRVAVISTEDQHAEATEAGADIVGADDLVEKIEKGFFDFDVLIATPKMMRSVGKLGKALGRKGLMPSPKLGTVTADLKKAVKEFKAGKVEYRADKFGIVNMPIGKISFKVDQLKGNYKVVYDTLIKVKPSTAKGLYIRSISLAPTMGPSVSVDVLKAKI
jgi:large subunit ribosomal protein L1